MSFGGFDPTADSWDSKRYRTESENRLPDDSPGIEYVCNARFVEYRDIADTAMLQHILETCRESNTVQPVFLVCFEADRENFSRAERLRARLSSHGVSWPIFVWIPRQRELSQLLLQSNKLNPHDAPESCRLIPFGQCYGNVSYGEINNSWTDWLARKLQLVHMESTHPLWTSAVGQLQQVLSEYTSDKLRSIDWNELGAVAERVWQSCSEWERASSRSCAAHAVLKASVLGLRIVDYRSLPSALLDIRVSPDTEESLRKMEHYRWLAERLLAGWRYAENRSNTGKTRWQITPWSGLESPPETIRQVAKEEGRTINEQMKDELTVRLIIGLIRIGLLRTESIDTTGSGNESE